ncbi:DUF3450 domain-containing protein [Litoribacillus peritrichatus]|uniref:DUF3450 domain-containing protein n=1 Tax=Litoribacillus peritrichatus TaxID=718191 RepID=A0ABP7MKF0_9GAMM
MKPNFFVLKTLYGCGLVFFCLNSNAMQLEQSQKKLSSSYQVSSKVQARIDALDEQTQQDYYEYVRTEKRAEQIEAYNRQLQTMINSQQQELEDLEQQLVSLTDTEQSALPLLNKMLSTLTAFVDNDLPFLQSERSVRLSRLTKLLDRADVSVAEKYRQVLEAYQIEVEYGRTLEAYSGTLSMANQANRDVTFLRLGRIGLFYQTSDGQQSGQWNADEHRWQALDSSQNWSIQKGIQLALKQTVPELLELPVRP